MIEQCLSNKNKSAIISKSKNFLDLNKTIIYYPTRVDEAEWITWAIQNYDTSSFFFEKYMIPVRNHFFNSSNFGNKRTKALECENEKNIMQVLLLNLMDLTFDAQTRQHFTIRGIYFFSVYMPTVTRLIWKGGS